MMTVAEKEIQNTSTKNFLFFQILIQYIDSIQNTNTNTNYKYTELTCLSEEVVLPSGLPHRCHCSTKRIQSHKLFSILQFYDETFYILQSYDEIFNDNEGAYDYVKETWGLGDGDDGESTENSKSKETWGPKLTTV